MFRRFEFRNLLGRVDQLDEAVPAAERRDVEGQEVAWREGELSRYDRPVGFAADDRALRRWRTGTESSVASARRSRRRGACATVVAHDAKSLAAS